MSRRKRLTVSAGVSLALHTLVLAALPGGSAAVAGAERARANAPMLEVEMLSAERARAILEPGRRRAAPALAEAPAPRDDASLEEVAAARTVASPQQLAWSPMSRSAFAPRVRFPESAAAESAVEVLTAPRRRRSAPDPTSETSPVESPRSTDPAPDAPALEQAPADLAGLRGLVLRRPPLAYPPTALRRGVEGRVTVGLRVDDAGRVVETWLLSSSGSALLDRAARDNLGMWRLDPEQLAGIATRRFRQDVRFELR